MQFRNTLAGALAALAVAAGPVHADPAVIGGTLLVAQPGPVTMQLVRNGMPSGVHWELPIVWSTGAGPASYGTTRAAGPDPFPSGGTLGQNGGGQPPATGVGTTVASPALAAGTPLIFGATFFVVPVNPVQLHQTGMLPGQEKTFGMPQFDRAAVVAGPGNTAWIGFGERLGTLDRSLGAVSFAQPPSLNFLDYPIQILVSNVCLR
jgi:hypothetical protein